MIQLSTTGKPVLSCRDLLGHLFCILLIALFSFTMNQMPFVLSSKPYSIGNDGDSGFHVAIQMRLRNPELFPKDIELNEMYLYSRPAFEFNIHRVVIWLADHLFGGNLFAANMATFWVYHLFYIVGCYLLGLFALQSSAGATLFAAVSVGLSPAISAWWGMVYAAVIPHDVGMASMPWFVLGYLRWTVQPKRLPWLFFMLGLAVNIYPLQPTYLALVLLAVTLFRSRPPLVQTVVLGIAFAIGALPSVLVLAGGMLEKLAASNPTDQAAIAALFARHYGHLQLVSLLRVGRALFSPVWLFLAIVGIGLLLKRRQAGLNRADRQLVAFTAWVMVLSLAGLVVGAVYRPWIVFLFHRASAFLYIPAYLGCIWLAINWIRGHTAARQAAGGVLVLLMMLNSTWQMALVYNLRGSRIMQSSAPYYSLADWALENTPVDSLFMVPYGGRSTYYAFRVYSERGVLLHWATGEIVLSYPQIGLQFFEMANDIEPLYKQGRDTAEFVRVAHKYDVDYIVVDSETPQPPKLPAVYRNEAYTVYAVPEPT